VRRGSDERAVLWTVLLPATPPRRTVLLGLPAAVRDGLLRRYPDAVVDGDPAGADLVVCTHAARPAAVQPGATFSRLDTREQVAACVHTAERAGLDFLVLDQTRPDIGVPVARVIVPGMRHFYRRFAPGRLYDVPVKLGWCDRPTPESELNPIHPHT